MADTDHEPYVPVTTRDQHHPRPTRSRIDPGVDILTADETVAVTAALGWAADSNTIDALVVTDYAVDLAARAVEVLCQLAARRTLTVAIHPNGRPIPPMTVLGEPAMRTIAAAINATPKMLHTPPLTAATRTIELSLNVWDCP